MATKKFSTLTRFPELELHHQIQFSIIPRTTPFMRWVAYSSAGDTFSVFKASQTGCKYKFRADPFWRPLLHTHTHTHIYIYIYICIYPFWRPLIHTHTHTYIYILSEDLSYTHTHTHIYIYPFWRPLVHTHTHAHTCTYIYTCVCVCVCVSIWISINFGVHHEEKSWH